MKKWNETWQNINDGFSETEILFSKMYIFFVNIKKNIFKENKHRMSTASD